MDRLTQRERELTAMLEKYQAIGEYDRLRELAEADKDGRVLVLPCTERQVRHEGRT